MWLIEGNDTLNVICKYFRPQGRARIQALRTEGLPKHIHHDRRRVDFARSSLLSYWSSSLSSQGLVLPKPLLVSVGACCVGGQEEGRQGQAMFSDHHHIFSSYVLKSSSYLHWDKHRLINVPWWHFDQSSELSSSYLHWKNTLWSNRHNGIFIKADKVKLCSLIINIYSVGQIPSDQLTMIVFWSVKGGKVKLHPLIVVLSSWGND